MAPVNIDVNFPTSQVAEVMESGVVDLTAMAFGMILGARSIPRCGKRWDFQCLPRRKCDFEGDIDDELMDGKWGARFSERHPDILDPCPLAEDYKKKSEVYFLVASKHPYIQILTLSVWKSLGRAFRPQILRLMCCIVLGPN